MIITKIEVQKKSTERFSVFVNRGQGEEYGFSVDQNTFIRYGLKPGQVLDDLSMTEIGLHEETRKAYLRAIHYLSYGMRTEKEVYDYLIKHEMSPGTASETVNKLRDERYVNDEEYARAYIKTHSNISQKGPIVIARNLRTKGISEEITTSILHEYSDNTQVSNAVKLCEKKLRAYKKFSTKETKSKLETMLMTKGYSYGVISEALESIDFDNSDEEQWDALVEQTRKCHQKYKKYKGYEYKNKMKQALYQKGFSIEDIEKAILALEEE